VAAASKAEATGIVDSNGPAGQADCHFILLIQQIGNQSPAAVPSASLRLGNGWQLPKAPLHRVDADLRLGGLHLILWARDLTVSLP
jgi:hypothetical protein